MEEGKDWLEYQRMKRERVGTDDLDGKRVVYGDPGA